MRPPIPLTPFQNTKTPKKALTTPSHSHPVAPPSATKPLPPPPPPNPSVRTPTDTPTATGTGGHGASFSSASTVLSDSGPPTGHANRIPTISSVPLSCRQEQQQGHANVSAGLSAEQKARIEANKREAMAKLPPHVRIELNRRQALAKLAERQASRQASNDHMNQSNSHSHASLRTPVAPRSHVHHPSQQRLTQSEPPRKGLGRTRPPTGRANNHPNPLKRPASWLQEEVEDSAVVGELTQLADMKRNMLNKRRALTQAGPGPSFSTNRPRSRHTTAGPPSQTSSGSQGIHTTEAGRGGHIQPGLGMLQEPLDLSNEALKRELTGLSSLRDTVSKKRVKMSQKQAYQKQLLSQISLSQTGPQPAATKAGPQQPEDSDVSEQDVIKELAELRKSKQRIFLAKMQQMDASAAFSSASSSFSSSSSSSLSSSSSSSARSSIGSVSSAKKRDTPNISMKRQRPVTLPSSPIPEPRRLVKMVKREGLTEQEKEQMVRLRQLIAGKKRSIAGLQGAKLKSVDQVLLNTLLFLSFI